LNPQAIGSGMTASKMRALGYALRPRAVAVVGASSSEDTLGSSLVRSITAYGYAGELYPVGSGGRCYGRKSFRRCRRSARRSTLSWSRSGPAFVLRSWLRRESSRRGPRWSLRMVSLRPGRRTGPQLGRPAGTRPQPGRPGSVRALDPRRPRDAQRGPMIRHVPEKVMQDQLDASLINTTEESS
jgi:hypothetical protein